LVPEPVPALPEPPPGASGPPLPPPDDAPDALFEDPLLPDPLPPDDPTDPSGTLCAWPGAVAAPGGTAGVGPGAGAFREPRTSVWLFFGSLQDALVFGCCEVVSCG
jgi:hypothetical protein